MEREALERPADLTTWRTTPTAGLRGTTARYGTLREAIAAAGHVLAEPAAQPWIVTEEGEMLSPVWIRTNLN